MGILIYTDAGQKAIMSMNVDGSGAKAVITGVDQPRAVVLDTRNQIMYWTDWGSTPRIEKARYDGSQRQVVVSQGIKYPNGLALDVNAGLLYFCDGGTGYIESIDTSGNNRQVIYMDYSAHFFGLTLTSKHIYYSDWNRKGLMRINRDGSGLIEAGPPTFTKINSLFSYQSGFTV